MIQLQYIVDFRGDNNNRIDLNILEREDANDQEREMARAIEALHLSVLEMLKEQMPGDVEIERIGA